MSHARADAIVVGAGMVGAACAEALARDGRRVLVLDARYAAAGATSAGMGHIVVMDDSPAHLALTAYSRGLWTERATRLPADCEDQACGTLWVAADEQEMIEVRRKARILGLHGLTAEVLDSRALAEAEPLLRPGLAGGLRVPDDRVLYPPNATRHLLQEATRQGAVIREGVQVHSLAPGEARTSAARLQAEVIVNAAGAQAPALAAGLPIAPRKGHLVITDRYPGRLRHQVVELGYVKSAHALGSESVAFNVQPRSTGQILIGSSREFVGWDACINRRLLARMLHRAAEYLPALERLDALRVWTGFRPATPDQQPLIGEWEPGLWVAAGHEGLGITTSLGTGQLLADLIAGRTPALDAAPYAPHRRMPATG